MFYWALKHPSDSHDPMIIDVMLQLTPCKPLFPPLDLVSYHQGQHSLEACTNTGNSSLLIRATQFFQSPVVDFSGWKIRVIDASEQGPRKLFEVRLTTIDIRFALLVSLECRGMCTRRELLPHPRTIQGSGV